MHALAGRSDALDALVEPAAATALYIAVALAIVLLWPRRQALRAATSALAGAPLALGAGAVVGALWDRSRPFVDGHYLPLVAHAADASFPSDHLIAVGALTAAAWLTWRPAGALLALVALVLAVARAVTGIHYISDLVGGFVMGAGATVTCWILLRPLLPLLDTLESRADRLPFRREMSGDAAPRSR